MIDSISIISAIVWFIIAVFGLFVLSKILGFGFGLGFFKAKKLSQEENKNGY